ncbi:hypothetical protein E3N88_17316 [Mikania micrantha]|uniref:Uncharacterized protein n=1 Tax=Mikania micrantha TaxID=192012 RepID=A0A5N6NT03_9ASTR|nr:hypothetical protein E3N88_17316 [Mikania micrantha]
MASCSMASAASRFLVTPSATAPNTTTAKFNMVMFPFQNTRCSRLVVKASDEADAPPATAEPATPAKEEKPKPPPIGPKRGAKDYANNHTRNSDMDLLGPIVLTSGSSFKKVPTISAFLAYVLHFYLFLLHT